MTNKQQTPFVIVIVIARRKWNHAHEREMRMRMRTKLYLGRTKIVATLDKLHARHALPGFADRTAEEKEIERLTTDITKVRLQSVGCFYLSPPPRFRFSFFLFFDGRVFFLASPVDTRHARVTLVLTRKVATDHLSRLPCLLLMCVATAPAWHGALNPTLRGVFVHSVEAANALSPWCRTGSFCILLCVACVVHGPC